MNLESGAAERGRFVERGRRLEYLTIFWNSLEALAALISGFIAGSVSLVFTPTTTPCSAKRLKAAPYGSSDRAS